MNRLFRNFCLPLILLPLFFLSLHGGGPIQFVDNFDYSSNGFWVGEDAEKLSVKLTNGFYVIERKDPKYATILRSSSAMQLRQNEEFRIQIRLQQARQGNDFGFLFGMSDIKSYHRYLWQPAGRTWTYDRYYDGYKVSYGGEKKLPKDLELNDFFDLRIDRKSDNWLYFYHNGEFSGKVPFDPLYGGLSGFWVGPSQKIVVDSLQLTTWSDVVPDGWTAQCVGNFESKLEMDEEYPEDLRITLFRETQLLLSYKLDNLHISSFETLVANPPNVVGANIDLYAITEDGANLLLRREFEDGFWRAIYSVKMGRKETKPGSLEIYDEQFVFKISQEENKLRGLVLNSEGAAREVGSVRWADTTRIVEVGISLSYSPSRPSAPDSAVFLISPQDFSTEKMVAVSRD